MDWKDPFDWLIVICAAGCLALATFFIVVTARSDGRIDYCYVEYNNDSSIHPPVWVVYGHRNWRSDQRITTAVSAEDAAVKKKEMCP